MNDRKEAARWGKNINEEFFHLFIGGYCYFPRYLRVELMEQSLGGWILFVEPEPHDVALVIGAKGNNFYALQTLASRIWERRFGLPIKVKLESPPISERKHVQLSYKAQSNWTPDIVPGYPESPGLRTLAEDALLLAGYDHIKIRFWKIDDPYGDKTGAQFVGTLLTQSEKDFVNLLGTPLLSAIAMTQGQRLLWKPTL
jgi:hypothetical protein